MIMSIGDVDGENGFKDLMYPSESAFSIGWSGVV